MRNTALRAFLRRFLTPEWPSLVLVVGLILVFALSGGAFAVLVGRAVQVVVEAGSGLGLLAVILAILGLSVLRGGLGYFQTLIAGRAGLRVNHALNRSLMQHVVSLPTERFKRDGPGLWVERIRGDSTILTQSTTQLALIASEGLSLLVYLAVAAWASWPLLLVGLGIIAAVGLVLNWINRRIARASHDAREASEAATRHLTATLTGHQTIKAQAAEDFEGQRWDARVAALNARLGQQVRALAGFQPAMEASVGLAFALVVGLGGALVLGGQAELAAIFSFLIAFVLAGQSFQRVQKALATAQPLVASAERVMRLLDDPAPQDRPTDPQTAARDLSLTAEALSLLAFAGDAGGDTAGDTGGDTGRDTGSAGLNLQIQGPGLFALAGPSGSGKSSLLKALAGLVQPDSGSARIGGIEATALSSAARRQCLAYVAQDATIFPESVVFNVAYGQDEADIDLARVQSALQAAQAGHLAAEPDASLLSGGEQQRVLLARALYQDAPILFLDEASAALDALLEEEFLALLESLRTAKLVLVVTHRLKAIESADAVFVLDRGRLVEQGTPAALKQQNGLFARLLKAEEGL